MNDIQISLLSDLNTQLRVKGFNIYQVACNNYHVLSHHKRIHFKICMDTGENIIHFADRSFQIKGTVLFITSPQVPYVWDKKASSNNGFACIFSERFLPTLNAAAQHHFDTILKNSRSIVIDLPKQSLDILSVLFKNLMENQAFQDDEHRQLISQGFTYMLNECSTLQSAVPTKNIIADSDRISMVFNDFLERQFPCEKLEYFQIEQYAQLMAITVQQLNTALKEKMGKSAETVLHERIMSEAHSLLTLQHADMKSVAGSLGFQDTQDFMFHYGQWTKNFPK